MTKKQEYNKEYYKRNKEQLQDKKKKYKEANLDKVREQERLSRERNKESIKDQQKEYRLKNREAILEKRKQYYQEHKEEILSKAKAYYDNNQDSIIERGREYYQKNKKEIYERREDYRKLYYSLRKDYIVYKSRISKLKTKYKLTEQELQEMMNNQKGCCLICGDSLIKPDNKTSYAIDHDHTTGEVRGLLCTRCNSLLEHSFEHLDKIHSYMINSISEPTNV